MFAGSLRFAGAAARPAGEAARWLDEPAFACRPDVEGYWRSGSVCVAERRRYNGRATLDREVPLRLRDEDVAAAFWGRLDDRHELVAALGLGPGETRAATDAALVLAAWRRWGPDLCEHLVGDFALAIVEAAEGRAFLARDPLGVKPLYYVLDGRELAFATSVAALRRFTGLTLSPDPDWMARYVVGLARSTTQTAFREVRKLPPGHRLTVDARGREDLRAWHRWRDDAPPADRRDPRWVAEYRAVLEEAVRCRMPEDAPLGSENSGGLDSASVTAYAACFLDDPGAGLHCFATAEHLEDPELIFATSTAHGIVHNHVLTGGPADHGRAARALALRVLGHPEWAEIAWSHVPFYEGCGVHGIRTLFSGFGGDQAASHQANHLSWELQDARRWTTLYGVLPGGRARRAAGVAKRAVGAHTMPEYNPGLLAGTRDIWPYHPLRAGVAERLGLHDALLEQARFTTPYRRINDFVIDRHLGGASIPIRLESCTLIAASFGVEYRWPLLDARLVQQYLSTPSIEKQGPQGLGRYLHRRAVDAVVPRSITWRRSKDVGRTGVMPGLQRAALAAALPDARALERGMHPALEELVDRARYGRLVELAERSPADDAVTACFPGYIKCLAVLDAWLREAAV